MSETLGWTLLLSYLALWALPGIWMNRRAARLLRERWPAFWTAAGKPSVLHSHGGVDWNKTLEAHGIRDDEVERIIRRSKYVDRLGAVGAVALAIILWLAEHRG
jgi:hypothetical protein